MIADISANHVEFFALRKGFSVQRIQNDYGIDLQLATYDAKGYIENGWISVQLKATDTIKMRSKGTAVAFTADARDLRMWQKEIYPVILIAVRRQDCKAYWTYVQRYFERRGQAWQEGQDARPSTPCEGSDQRHRASPVCGLQESGSRSCGSPRQPPLSP
ncbi:MAG: DUF4365 domain-containing protein [Polyangiaceae bacterium]|nr:DUF4365 domain-containing protein [Polyangiaceae bacterium]